MGTFLTAEWHAVLGITYPVDEALLEPHLPRGAEIDHLDGAARVSLVAFRFRHTRVFGVPIPGHVNFPEINLRFYVRLNGERGVVFIREFVPRPAIAWAARVFYNEPYKTIRMRDWVLPHTATDSPLRVRHRFGPAFRNWLQASADREPRLPEPGSPEYWLTHHDLGVGRARDGSVTSYRVEHDPWALHHVRDLQVDVDFAALYGAQWGFLRRTEPSHVTLAEGSRVRIMSPGDG